MTGFADDPDVDLIAHETDRLLETIHTLSDDDVRQPSLCPGWSRGHVLTHIARNADGLRDVLRAAANGGDGAFYESQAVRDADIEAGAGRTAAELEADVETSADRLLEAIAETPAEVLDVRVPRLRVVDDPERQVMIPAGKTLALRVRELVFHHCDLDAGYTLADAQPDWVTGEIAYSVRRFTGGPAVVVDAGVAGTWRYGRDDEDAVTVSGTPLALLGWISGRGPRDGLTSSSGTLPRPRTVGMSVMAEPSSYTGSVQPGGRTDVRELEHVVIRKASVSAMHNNCYLLTSRATGAQLLIDAADDATRLLGLVHEGSPDGRLDLVVTTHQHWDHHRALRDVLAATGADSSAGIDDAGELPVMPDRLLSQGIRSRSGT